GRSASRRSEVTARQPNLPATPIVYSVARVARRLRDGERLDHRYDAAGYRVFESARLARGTDHDVAWASIQRFPAIWSSLPTTKGTRTVVRAPGATSDIAVGSVIHANAVVFGAPVPMRNIVTDVIEGRMFHL